MEREREARGVRAQITENIRKCEENAGGKMDRGEKKTILHTTTTRCMLLSLKLKLLEIMQKVKLS